MHKPGGGGRGAAGADFERHRREDWGAEGDEVWGGGVPVPTGEGYGEGLCSKFFDFVSIWWVLDVWCILSGIFTVLQPVLHAKWYNIGALPLNL